MKHITETLTTEICSSALFNFYFKGYKAGVLDIETTGLNPAVNKFILGGLYNSTDGTMHQVFAEEKAEENQALISFIDQVTKLDYVITYNGKHFDMPFIERRMKSHFGSCPGLPYNLDLYLVLNGHSPLRKLMPNLKQKTVENYMGLWQNRKDEISGAESVELYNLYEKTRDPALEEKILLHNRDDVVQLTRLTSVIMKSDFHKAMFHLGFPAESLHIEQLTLRRNEMIIRGRQAGDEFDYVGYNWGNCNVESRFDSKRKEFLLVLPLLMKDGYIIADLEALGLDENEFSDYPTCSDGFLVLESTAHEPHKNYMEINHLAKVFIRRFLNTI